MKTSKKIEILLKSKKIPIKEKKTQQESKKYRNLISVFIAERLHSHESFRRDVAAFTVDLAIDIALSAAEFSKAVAFFDFFALAS